MDNRILFVADIKNLFYGVKKKYGDRRLDYDKLIHYTRILGGHVTARAYGMQISDEAQPFITKLTNLGYEVFYRLRRFSSSSWNCGITIDILNISNRVDTVIVASSDNDLLPLYDELRRRGIEVIVIGVGISRDIRIVANKVIEIDETFLSTDDDVLEVPQAA